MIKPMQEIFSVKPQLTSEESFLKLIAEELDKPLVFKDNSYYKTRPIEYCETYLNQRYTGQIKNVVNTLMKRKRVIVTSGHSSGKCNSIDETLMLADGRCKRVQDLLKEPFYINTWTERGVQPVKATAEWNKKEGESVYRITTLSGRSISRNYHHPLQLSYIGSDKWAWTGVGNIDYLIRNFPLVNWQVAVFDGKHIIWETVLEVNEEGVLPTIGITVPKYHTYLTEFYEHNTHLSGGLVNWFYEVNDPGIVITTAPNAKQLKETVWKEVRSQREILGPEAMEHLSPAAPMMRSSSNHFATGYTAREGTGFHGRKEENILLIFEEATGIRPEIWEAAEGMLFGPSAYQICFLNPTSTASQAYSESISGKYAVIELSCLDHPNVQRGIENLRRAARGLEVLPLEFPKATLDLNWCLDKLRSLDWCVPIVYSERTPADFAFPVNPFTLEVVDSFDEKDWHWFRPTPKAEARMLGRFPSQSESAVWSTSSWNSAIRNPEFNYKPLEIPKGVIPELGVDIAGKGFDYTVIAWRIGPVLLDLERHGNWKLDQIAGRIKEICNALGEKYDCDPTAIPVKYDDSNMGGGLDSHAGDYNFVPILAQSSADDKEHYPNRRSELWFITADRAVSFDLDFSRLSQDKLDRLRMQLLAPEYTMDNRGRRVVEIKKITKLKIKQSPDDADAVNLAYCVPGRVSQDTEFTPEAAALLRKWTNSYSSRSF